MGGRRGDVWVGGGEMCGWEEGRCVGGRREDVWVGGGEMCGWEENHPVRTLKRCNHQAITRRGSGMGGARKGEESHKLTLGDVLVTVNSREVHSGYIPRVVLVRYVTGTQICVR